MKVGMRNPMFQFLLSRFTAKMSCSDSSLIHGCSPNLRKMKLASFASSDASGTVSVLPTTTVGTWVNADSATLHLNGVSSIWSKVTLRYWMYPKTGDSFTRRAVQVDISCSTSVTTPSSVWQSIAISNRQWPIRSCVLERSLPGCRNNRQFCELRSNDRRSRNYPLVSEKFAFR